MNIEYDKNLTLEQATNIFFGTQNVSNRFKKFYNSLDMNYRTLSENENIALSAEINDKILNDTKNVSNPERSQVWFNGWQENLETFRQNKTLEAITPKFLRPNNPVRFNGQYIIPSNPFFERDMSKLFQIFIYDKFVLKENINEIYEFGCGSGFNLLFLSEFYKDLIPDMSLVGLDFVQSSVDLINELGAHYKYKLNGKLFDMKNPDNTYKLSNNSCAFTACSLEQLGSSHFKFIDYLVKQNLKICFHLEPIIENYDPTIDFDKVAIRFHKKRGYLEGLKPHLYNLKNSGIIDIVFDKRFMFGSLFHEGYQLIVWRKNG